MVDARDLKSLVGNNVPVRVRPPAPEKLSSFELDFFVKKISAFLLVIFLFVPNENF